MGSFDKRLWRRTRTQTVGNLRVSILDGEVGPSLRVEISPIPRAICKHKHKNLDRVVSFLLDMPVVGTNYFMQELKLLSAAAWAVILEVDCAYTSKFPSGFDQTLKDKRLWRRTRTQTVGNLRVSIIDGEVGPSLRVEISPIPRAICKHKHKNLDRVVSLLLDMRVVGTNYFLQELK
ncbi:hypothetical protein E3N88_14396 [Mikania micrantha]|uniref:Uncharacterized protein n=1 Tax=Mikania micrantha TaxID=192012 RepID=A0A5N6P3X5_9ASTR|nr:hypothetical protein E3N88_14396 [Mikania micrantha]